ncbi:MAG TPA: hypothetical protein PLA50_00965 [Bacteroidia bacterium]|nr:hypothetical protein [Bacteroidia bacterium]
MNSKCKILTASPRPLEAARALRDRLLNAQVHGVPPRLWPVVIDAEEEGYHVAEAGFAAAHGFEVVR